MIPKNTICLWYDGNALDAATFYAKTFPDSAVGAVHRAPGDFPAVRAPGAGCQRSCIRPLRDDPAGTRVVRGAWLASRSIG